MASFYDLTAGQIVELHRVLSSKGFTREKAEFIIQHPELASLMVGAVDDPRSRMASIQWTPVGEYVERIMDRSRLCDWGFNELDAIQLGAALHDHASPFMPTSVSIWLCNLTRSWSEMMYWLRDEVCMLGYSLETYFNPGCISFQPGSEQDGFRRLSVVDLDIGTFWDVANGMTPRDVRLFMPRWPGLEVATLLALNPLVCIAMNGLTVPFMLAPGLNVSSHTIPLFTSHNRVVVVAGGSLSHPSSCATMVAYRKGTA